MVGLILLITIALAAFIIFAKSRWSNNGRYWTNQTFNERLALSIGLGAAIQFLFFTMIPGWIVAAYLVGYSGGTETFLSNAIWGIVEVIANTLLYSTIFYLPLQLLNNLHKKKQV